MLALAHGRTNNLTADLASGSCERIALADGGAACAFAETARCFDNEAVVERLLKRAEIEGRADDNEETIRERMRVYDSETAPLIEFYKSRELLTEVSGMGTVEEVGQRVKEALA